MSIIEPLHITVFCSAKGGVGKSSLAFVTGRMKAKSPSGAVLLDLDLTGTPMIEGLPLLAPDGTGGFRTRADSLQWLDTRKHAKPDPLALRDPPFTHESSGTSKTRAAIESRLASGRSSTRALCANVAETVTGRSSV